MCVGCAAFPCMHNCGVKLLEVSTALRFAPLSSSLCQVLFSQASATPLAFRVFQRSACMQSKFEKVSIVMPWMYLDTLQAFMPQEPTPPAPQSNLLPTIDMLLLRTTTIATTTAPLHPDATEQQQQQQQNRRQQNECLAQIREMLKKDFEAVMVARAAHDAWEPCVVSHEVRQRLRCLIQWAVPQLVASWQDTWDTAGTADLTASGVIRTWVSFLYERWSIFSL